MSRDDFSANTRRLLASRAAFLCSNPSCRVITIGPSQESTDKVATVGVAAHIAGAAPKGPRYDGSMTSEYRASSDNGIWLCATHATLIDRDVSRFPVETLRAWKAQHERYVEQNIGQAIISDSVPALGGRPISNEAARIVAERGDAWEERLFGQLLRDEITKSRDDTRDLKYAITSRPLREVDIEQLRELIPRAMRDAMAALSSTTKLIHISLPEAVGPMNVPGDAEMIEYVAHRLGDVYRRIVQWGLEWVHTRCVVAKAEPLLELLSRFMTQVQSALEGIPDLIERAYEEGSALLAIDPDREFSMPVKVTLEIPEEIADAVVIEAKRVFGSP